MAIEYDREDIASGYNLSKINNNFAKIETALADGLSRTGGTPNQMEADIDLNSHDLLNVKMIDTDNSKYRGGTLAPEGLVVTDAMLGSQYDPQDVGGDVFLFSTHTDKLANSQLDDVASGTIKGRVAVGAGAPTDLTTDQVVNLLDPNSYVLQGEGLRLTYHKARAGWHVKEFNPSLSAVGAGNTSVDQAAMQAALNSQQMVDITSSILQIEDPLTINYASANVSAFAQSGRVGDTATSKFKIMDDTMPYLFDCQSTNAEFSNFAVTGNTTNTTTTVFNFQRPSGSASDIDSVIKNVVVERAAKGFHIYGRGLEVGGCTFAEMKTCAGDIDWPSVWTPNGQSNDTQETGMRSYHFYDTRLHGNIAGFRNIGANAQNMRGLIVNGALADIGSGGTGGGGIFIGVLGEGSILTNLVANISASIAGGLVNLHAGSRSSVISNFTCKGIVPTSGASRLLRTPITIETTVANPVNDLVFANGSLGVCNRYGVSLSGAGTAYLTFTGVNFERTGIEGSQYTPLFVTQTGGTLTDVFFKLSSCNFQFGSVTPPVAILGGLSSSAIRLIRDYSVTKPGAVPWVSGSQTNTGP